VTQRLARFAIDVATLERKARDPAVLTGLRQVREGLARLSEDVHALSYRLHPSVLEDLGLEEALQAECARFSRQESIAAELEVRRLPEPVPIESALCLYRIAQEALRNVSRHARARAVTVTLHGMEGGVQIAVRDDGTGFDAAAPRHRRGLGLSSMRERAHLLGGELDLESAPGEGTTVVAWVPVPAAS
jgi:signal transduction histidine kinase